ncbi:MAG: ammonia channel protein [Syntrophus sp. (in: bacteria)]|nr:ammonia channel protein [Syntrophus sp. (in: bacteria)]
MKRILACLILLLLLASIGIVFAEEPKVVEGATLPTGGQTQAPANIYSPQSGREGVAPTALPVEGATRAPVIDSGDTAWVLISTALVLLMTPGLAFFYGGMVGRKNVLGVLMQCFTILCIVSIQWVLYGYSLSFAPGSGFWGGFSWSGLANVGFAPYKDYAATIPHQLFMAYQMMFAVITPALIIGAFAGRMKFSAFVIFTILWATFVYDPVCHWVWGVGGWLKDLGALDFAGGTVVHINAGIAALMTAIFIGKRNGTTNKVILPHNLPFTILGTALLWFGWFGFNAGSALGANELAVNAFVVTNTAAAAAGLTWALIDWIFNDKPTMLGTATGAVAGLVAITPAAGFVSALSAIIIGVLVSVFCYMAVTLIKPKFGYDDALDVFGVHCIGGIWGALATGLFASKAINPAGADGLFFGNPKQLLVQAAAVGVTVVYSFVASYIIYKLIDVVMKVRVTKKDETIGLDLTQHHENAYTIME